MSGSGPLLAVAAVGALYALSQSGQQAPPAEPEQSTDRVMMGAAIGAGIGGAAAYVGGFGPIPYSLTFFGAPAVAAGAAVGAGVGAQVAQGGGFLPSWLTLPGF